MEIVHVNKSEWDVAIGRPSKWGNPFKIGAPHPVTGRPMTRDEVIDLHFEWFGQQTELILDLPELFGKRLGCWCRPRRCHGDNLIRWAEIAWGYRFNR